jgi:seryl-tRNA synthetase
MILESHKKYYIEHLKEKGAKQELAEAIIELHIENGEHLATKADIIHLENVTKADINRLESATKADIARLESTTKAEMGNIQINIKWLIAISLATLTILLTPLFKPAGTMVASLIQSLIS